MKICVKRGAVLAKFTQHKELLELLLLTEDAKIVEQTENDHYWGDDGDGKGKNMLNRILMEIREKLPSGSGQRAHATKHGSNSCLQVSLTQLVDRRRV